MKIEVILKSGARFKIKAKDFRMTKDGNCQCTGYSFVDVSKFSKVPLNIVPQEIAAVLIKK